VGVSPTFFLIRPSTLRPSTFRLCPCPAPSTSKSNSPDSAFFDDLDQTIYEWRGSKPDEVIQRVKADFGPVTALSLRDNYRATKALLRVADRHASNITRRSTEVRAAPSLADGLPPEFHHAENSTAEAHWSATRIRNLVAAMKSSHLTRSALAEKSAPLPPPSPRSSKAKLTSPSIPWSKSPTP